jgi:raffinose/stachyose/melibiose transport system permease protein
MTALETTSQKSTRPERRAAPGLSRKKVLRVFATIIMVTYTLLTVSPFYVLFVRSFVSTKDTTELHLWIPPAEEINLDAQIGNLAVFYNLEMSQLKADLGIPATDFLMARTTLREVAEQYNIPEDKVRAYFKGFSTYNGWKSLMQGGDFTASLLRTVLITVLSLALLTVLSIATGYGLSRLRTRFQILVYNMYLLQMVIPAMLIILPQFLIVQAILRLFPGFDSSGPMRWALQVMAVVMINIKGGAISAMIFTSAISAIPKDLEESAQIDGASPMQYLRYILLPLLKVPIISLIVIQLPLIWNQFLEPYIYMDPKNTTLLPFIQNTVGTYSTNYQVIYAAIFFSVLPLAIIYLAFRRFFIQGVLEGAVKG